jgi:hypothetical protein
MRSSTSLPSQRRRVYLLPNLSATERPLFSLRCTLSEGYDVASGAAFRALDGGCGWPARDPADRMTTNVGHKISTMFPMYITVRRCAIPCRRGNKPRCQMDCIESASRYAGSANRPQPRLVSAPQYKGWYEGDCRSWPCCFAGAAALYQAWA